MSDFHTYVIEIEPGLGKSATSYLLGKFTERLKEYNLEKTETKEEDGKLFWVCITRDPIDLEAKKFLHNPPISRFVC